MTTDATGCEVLATDADGASNAVARADRIDRLVRSNYQFVWRSLRRLGVKESSVDDATQQVFIVAARRIDDIESGSELAFLFGTAMRVAADARRVTNRLKARELADDGVLERLPDMTADPAERYEESVRRRLLDEVLDGLPDDLRPVFVLFELEGLSSPEIAGILDIPVGTVASRLRRAREQFHTVATRVRQKQSFRGAVP